MPVGDPVELNTPPRALNPLLEALYIEHNGLSLRTMEGLSVGKA